MTEQIKLSISILVSNSVDTIEKCMKSLQPILENVTSELIIVDTGGTDGSIEVARKYATKVIPFTWCNDFAKARNAGLFEAKGEWFMFLDDDEWFEDVEPIISFFNTEEYLKYNSASYGIRNYSNKQGTKWEEVPTHRMVKKEKQTKFVSPIHETLTPIRFPVKRLDCFVHHYGYAYESEQEARKHSYRNIPLLKDVLKKNPEDYRLTLQLIKEYCVIKEYEIAENLSWDAIKRIEKKGDFTNNNVRVLGWILVNIIKMYVINDEYKEGVFYAESFIKYQWINEITKNNLAYYIVNMCYEKKEYEKCLEYIPCYENTYSRLIKDYEYLKGQAILEQETILTESILSKMYTMGACSACIKEDKEKVDLYFSKITNLESYIKPVKELKIIFKYILQEEVSNKDKIIEHLSESMETMDNISKIMDEDFFDDSMKEKLCIILSNIRSNSTKLLPYHIYASHLKQLNKEENKEVKKYLDFYIGHQDNILEIIYPLLTLIKEYGNDVIEVIEKKDLTTWTKQQNNFVLQAPEKKVDVWISIIEESTNRGFNTDMLYMRCMERKMQCKNMADKTYREVHEILNKYSSTVRNVYKCVYKEEVFSNEFNVFLPKNCRFVETVKDVICGKLDKTEVARIMRDAAKIYPEIAEFCKCYVIKMNEAENKEEVRNEFVELGNRIKEKINIFIDQGEYEMARQTLKQLKLMLPDDVELLELESRVLN